MKAAEFKAATRMAWREAKRNRWRSLLVVAMIALPVAGLTTAAISIRTASPSFEERATGLMGRAELAIMGFSSDDPALTDPASYQKVLPAGTQFAVQRNLAGESTLGGAYDYVNLTDGPTIGATVGMYQVLEGRAPNAKNEVAVHPRLLERRGLEIGDTFVVDEPLLELTVVGVAVAPEAVWDPIGLLAPGSLAGYEDTAVNLFIDLPDETSIQDAVAKIQAAQPVSTVDRRSIVELSGATEAMGASFAIAALALVETGLIAAAAFTVGARRQLRALGLLAAAGGEARHTRLTVLAGGLVLGLVGSLTGVAIGVVGALLVQPHLDTIAGRVTGPLDPSPLFLLGAVVLGTTAATLAALTPAKAAARLDPTDALAGRTAPPPPPARLARWGLAALIIGGVITGWGTVKFESVVQAIGLVILMGGFLVLIPTMVKVLGDSAHRLPTAGRLAARDTARHARRTGAAVAAATVALAMPVAVAGWLAGQERSESAIPALAEDHVIVQPGLSADGSESTLVDDLLSAFPGAIAADLRQASWDPAAYPVLQEMAGGEAAADWGVWAMIPGIADDFSDEQGGPLMIADAGLLTALHAEDAINELETGQIVALGAMRPEGTPADLQVPPKSASEEWTQITAATSDGPATRFDDGWLPAFVISEERAAELGITDASYSSGTLIRLPSDLSKPKLAEARLLATAYEGAAVYSLFDTQPSNAAFKAVTFAVGAGVALAILTVAIALVASESRRDQAILASVGAGPAMRRKVAGTGGFLLAGLAGVLAVPAGFVPVAIIQASQPNPLPVVVPWLTVLAVAVLVPVIAGVGSALGSREPSTRRMLDPVV